MDLGGLSDPLSLPTVFSALRFLYVLNFKQTFWERAGVHAGGMKEGSQEAFRGSRPAPPAAVGWKSVCSRQRAATGSNTLYGAEEGGRLANANDVTLSRTVSRCDYADSSVNGDYI